MLGFKPSGKLPLGALPEQGYVVIAAAAMSSGYGSAYAVYDMPGSTVASLGSSYSVAVSYVFWSDVETAFVQCENTVLVVGEECREFSIPPKPGCC